MPLLNQDRTINPNGLFDLLLHEGLSARAKVLVLLLAFTQNGSQINQEELSKVLGSNSKSDTVRRTVEEAEYEGWIEVDRSVKPHWYRVSSI